MANKNITPQYQSYGETSARGEQSPMEALTFKVPLTPISKAAARKRKVKVMDEDEYVEKVEKIIERDFFPELEKLKAQSDYMDARDRKDYETMSRLEEKYSGVRPDTGRRMQSPATFDTPLDQPRDTDPRRPQQGQEGDAEGDKQEGAGAEEGKEDEDRVTLDKFMANHTSEDNESFIELQVENEKKHRAKNAWMYKDEAMYLEMKAQQMALPSMEQQAALPYKPGNVDTWTYQNINSVFHNPDGLELTEVEKIENAKNEKKEVEQREGAAGKDLVKPETPSVKNPPDIHSKVYQRIKMIEAQHLAASRARMYARIEAAAEKRRESIAKATMSAPTDAAAVEQKRKEYVKSVLIERKKAAWARASVLRKSQTKKLNI